MVSARKKREGEKSACLDNKGPNSYETLCIQIRISKMALNKLVVKKREYRLRIQNVDSSKESEYLFPQRRIKGCIFCPFFFYTSLIPNWKW